MKDCAAQSPPLGGGWRGAPGGVVVPPLSPYGDISPKGGDFRRFVFFRRL